MTPYPYELHLVAIHLGQKGVPQLRVEGGGLVPLDPALCLPGAGPTLGDAVNDVLGIRGQGHLTRLLEGGQGGDDGGQLHAVVGGFGVSARKLLLPTVVDQDGAPASGAGIAAAGAVGVDLDLGHGLFLSETVRCGNVWQGRSGSHDRGK